ncbi:CGI-121-domain-containing protein [Rhizoclosmatium globosum]|uniref:EKC/KEOPS complex subunit CGI121 n=1 Tax=Rhizoclosmatium globosum TaxID=329046 RepID=A0A1Y2CS11_9FUNG|nr:CGI-121-domain-containing protein [Rhizoclosmatium globosum]|eukprot:ORY49839.1 CGI-121-domain-containing protein [Rhizoclosmatium globosum]
MENITQIPVPSLFNPYDPNAASTETPAEAKNGHPSVFYALLFQNVSNAKELKAKVIAGDPELPQCVMVNPALVLSSFQLQTACSRAYMNQAQNNMKTKTILSEILFSLSPSLNIAESMKLFGLSDNSNSIFVLVPSADDASVDETTINKLKNLVQGDLSPAHSFSDLTDLKLLKKVYKLNDAVDQSNTVLEDLIVGGIATKGFL